MIQSHSYLSISLFFLYAVVLSEQWKPYIDSNRTINIRNQIPRQILEREASLMSGVRWTEDFDLLLCLVWLVVWNDENYHYLLRPLFSPLFSQKKWAKHGHLLFPPSAGVLCSRDAVRLWRHKRVVVDQNIVVSPTPLHWRRSKIFSCIHHIIFGGAHQQVTTHHT